MRKKGEGAGVPRRPQPGTLSREDAELWSRTAASLERLRRAKPRVTSGAAAHVTGPQDVPAPPVPPISHPSTKPLRASPHSRQAPRGEPGATPPAPAVLDRRKARRIATGHIEIEARIDLHGLRQAEAHRRLRAFLLETQARGLRTVLVITGKGKERERAGETLDPLSKEERGIIRRSVPLWLEERELRALVVSYTPAHARHGGVGALYVQLRRRRG